MKLAIMQPYFFPYAGYFNLISKVDKFVFYDDVNFIKGGWINRNRLFLSGDVRYFTVPLSGASPNQKIMDVKIQPKSTWERKLLEGIKQSYSKAPNFNMTYDLIRDVINNEDDRVSQFAKRSIKKTSERLGLQVAFVDSSSDYSNSYLSGVERVLDICVKNGAEIYVNLSGGKDLYCENVFLEQDIKLVFSSPALVPYKQFGRSFQAGLSILDMMMFNDFETCRELVSLELIG